MFKRMKSHNVLAIGMIIGLMAFGWVGCSEVPTGTDGVTEYTAENPPPFLTGGSAGVLGVAEYDKSWQVIAKGEVDPDESETVAGGRYTLRFPEGSVPYEADISISEWNENVVEFQLGPHGIEFKRAVLLTIDVSGTNCDPESKLYDGSVPVFYWFNPTTEYWERLSASLDKEHRTISVKLSHFSRYAVAATPKGGTADW